MTECVTCGRGVIDAFLCSSCTDGLAKDLSEITALDADLAVTYARQSRISRSVGARSDVRPLPWDERAAKHRTALKATLVAIVRDLHESQPLLIGPTCLQVTHIHEVCRKPPRCGHASCRAILTDPLPADNVASMVAWLLGRLERIRQHEAADETVREVHGLIEEGDRVCSGPALVIYAGPCQAADPSPDDYDEVCGASLYVDASWDEKAEQHKPIDKPIVCPRCEAVTEARKQREYLLAEIDGMLVPMATAAKWLTAFGVEVPSSTIRTWKERGQIMARSIDREGRELFAISDVRALHEAAQERAARRKRA